MTTKVRALESGVNGLWLALLLLVAAIQAAVSFRPAQAARDGEAIFRIDCSGCHTIGGGNAFGPDLKGITQTREQQWLVDFINSPSRVIASGDSIANSLVKQYNNFVMPGLSLSQEEITSVINYIKTKSVAPKDTTVTAGIGGGNPENGKAIFIEEVKLANGGPPCIACHSIDAVGILGGGVMGPDLTLAGAIYGEADLASRLADITFPTMQPIFINHPLTASEQADLVAYIVSAVNQPTSDKSVMVLAVSLAGFLAILAVAGLYWRGRLQSVRGALVKRSQIMK